jgi:hypothetical protein
MTGMDLDNHDTKQVYIQLLTEVLQKKIEVFHKLLDLTLRQENIIGAEPFTEDEFLQTISKKETQINDLSKLDSGFEKLYNSVKEELSLNKDKYKNEISLLKDQISAITELSVKIQATEKRNKTKLEAVLARKRKDIKTARISSQTATNYYKTMANQHEAQSFFYDKKK